MKKQDSIILDFLAAVAKETKNGKAVIISEDLFLIFEIMKELQRAECKFPLWPVDPIHAAAIVNEESGELVRASLKYSYENGSVDDIKTEATQTAAMCIRFLKNINTYKQITHI